METEEVPQPTLTGRGRSTLAFPYSDLGRCEDIARVLFEHGGEAAPEQLAAWLTPSVSPISGAFRSRLTAALMFGLIERVRGRLRLTDLANRLLDPQTAAPARVAAFMNVPLFAAVFNEFHGRPLPTAGALEQHVARMGVAPKQADRARQTLQRSAALAGFFDAAPDRLVIPFADGPAAPPDTSASPPSPPEAVNPPVDPMLRGLFERLPPAGEPWDEAARKHWLDAARSIFILVYGPLDGDDS